MPEPDKFITIEELSRHLAVSVSTIRGWYRQGIIPKETYFKAGSTYRFNLPRVIAALTNIPDKEVKQQEPIVGPEEKIPEQLELDFGNPDEDK
jgi:hypothetical protein